MNEERPENGSKWIFSSLFTKGLERSRSLEKISYSGQDTNKKCVDNQIICGERSPVLAREAARARRPLPALSLSLSPLMGGEGNIM